LICVAIGMVVFYSDTQRQKKNIVFLHVNCDIRKSDTKIKIQKIDKKNRINVFIIISRIIVNQLL